MNVNNNLNPKCFKKWKSLTIFLLFNVSFMNGQDICNQFSNCGCTYSSGHTVDLSPLANSDGTPRFKHIPDSMGEMYSWNPCQSFTEGDDECTDVAVCTIHQNIPNPAYFAIGTQDTANFSIGSDGNLSLEYDFFGTGGARRSSFITLLCDEDTEGNLLPMGENPLGSGLYYFALSSKYACPPHVCPPQGFSTRWIILIVVLVLAFAYFVAGMIFQKLVRKRTGKEILPNYSFWAAIPMYIASGILFVFCCNRKGYTNLSGR